MARITVEDCLERIPNRFQLVLIASKRARMLERGAQPTLEWENDKPTVMALREIAEDKVDASILDEEIPAPRSPAAEFGLARLMALRPEGEEGAEGGEAAQSAQPSGPAVSGAGAGGEGAAEPAAAGDSEAS